MLKVALCDDDAGQRAALSELLQTYALERPELAVKISAFSSGEEVLSAEAKGERFELYVLDVVMPGMSGIDLGIKLRERGRTGAIVYLTVTPEYAVDSYAAQAFYYLLKPVSMERLSQVLDDAVASITRLREACITVKTKECLRLVRLDRIRYVELTGRTACYHLTGIERVDSVTMRSSFQTEMAPLLANQGFFACGGKLCGQFLLCNGHREALSDHGGRRPRAAGAGIGRSDPTAVERLLAEQSAAGCMLLIRQLNNRRINNIKFDAVLLAPCGATAKHGTYYFGNQ